MRRLLITAAAALTLLAGCGGADLGTEGGGSSSTGTGSTGTGTGTTGTTTYSMGNGSGSSFQSGVIGVSSDNVAAGGTTSLTITVVDENGVLYTAAPVTVSYSSTCISSGLAVIAPSGTSTAGTTSNTVTSPTGTIDATYTAKGCSGSDVITATATVGSTALTATGTVTVAAAAIGSIQFESATPPSIGLKGTGLNETSKVAFKVVDSTGAARPGVTVNFTLNTSAGGLSLSPSTAVSAADGTVQTTVSSGTVHTVVRVTATITSSVSFSTESSNLTVSTGLPASGGFSIAVGAPSYGSLACPNVEAASVYFFTVPVTVQLLDRYNNPVPDDTAVTFTTDGGAVTSSCATGVATSGVTEVPVAGSGQCIVNWTSSNPFPTTSSTPPAFRNGRAQILATAIGEESFDDVAGTGYYQAGDPFSNLGEPYLDANESGAYVLGDPFDPYYPGVYKGPSGNFVGITCTATKCTEATLGIGVEHSMVMSTSTAHAFMSVTSPYTTYTNLAPVTITEGTTGGFVVLITDLNGNAMAAGTTVSASWPTGTATVGQSGTYTVGCNSTGGPGTSSPYTIPSGVITGGRTTAGGDAVAVSLTAPSTTGSGTLTITVTSPESKSISTFGIQVSVVAPPP